MKVTVLVKVPACPNCFYVYKRHSLLGKRKCPVCGKIDEPVPITVNDIVELDPRNK